MFNRHLRPHFTLRLTHEKRCEESCYYAAITETNMPKTYCITTGFNYSVRVKYLSVVVDARDEAVEVKQVKGRAKSVTQRRQPRGLQVLQLTHKSGMVLLPAGLTYRQRENEHSYETSEA